MRGSLLVLCKQSGIGDLTFGVANFWSKPITTA
uniref:Uncharacterized protein n=1 Tax=Arundo donax TaxID=35708 RepID=A0A0A8XZN0_ARUDO